MITLNAIEQRLRQFAENHFFIHSYGFGSPDEVDLDKYTAFPLLYVVYTGATYDDNKAYSFEVYVLDRPTEQEAKSENRREVVSDSEQCLEDLVADVTTGFNIFQWDEAYTVEAASVSPIVDARTNVLSGALLDLTISVPYQYESCNIPIDGVQPEGGEISYARRGLLRILTQDGTTDVPSVNTIKVTNGTLTDEGDGVVSIDTGGVDTLGDLTDVASDVTTEAIDRHALVYDEDSGEWIPRYPGEIRVINQSGETILKGQLATAVGAQGDQVKVKPYDSQDDWRYLVGIATEEMVHGASGHVITLGEVRGLDTDQFKVGDLLYPTGLINSFSPFGLTKFGETAGGPDNPLPIAICTRSHANTGRIQVRMWTPGHVKQLAGLSDVYVPSPYIGAILKYVKVGSTSFWGYLPQTSKTILDGATEDVEIYYYAEGGDTQLDTNALSDTPSAGNKIVRKIWYATSSQADPDTGTWTLYQTLADNSTFAQLQAAFEASLLVSPTGGQPVSIKTTWEDIPAFTGLLDTYPGAAAAYSLRLLDSTYTGDAINVRRASDNAVQDIGFDANGDLDTAALASFCSGTDGYVVRWYDQSGNGNDAVQATTSAQPKVYDSVTGVVTENSLPALQGSNTCTMNIASSIIGAGDYSVYTVHTFSEVLMLYGGAMPTFGIWNINGDILQRFDDGTNAALTASYVSGDRILSYQNRASGAWEIAANGGAPATGTNTASLTIDRLFTGFGGGYKFAGKVQEFIFYESDQSANRTGIESNINTYYNIF